MDTGTPDAALSNNKKGGFLMSFSARIAFVFAMAVCSSAQADVLYVDDDNCPGPGTGTAADPYCLIQTAIDRAKDNDVIVVAQGTYTETINLLGKSITLRSKAPTDPAVLVATIIDGDGIGTAVTCDSGEGPDTVISGFVITGGTAPDVWPDNRGGGMYNVGSSPTVINCVFVGNVSDVDDGTGGGMANVASSPMVINCRFSMNSAAHQGGGMSNEAGSSPTVVNCLFSGNTVGDPVVWDGNGGGLYADATSRPTVKGCTFSNNVALNEQSDGGGIGLFGGGTVTDCLMTGNESDFGGGMAGIGFTISNSVIADNYAHSDGGGMYHGHGVTVINCMISGNRAQLPDPDNNFFGGGGIYSTLGNSPTISNSTICGNLFDEINGAPIIDRGGNIIGTHCPPPLTRSMPPWSNTGPRPCSEDVLQ